MCCLSKASSHFVVFVCENPDREPSRKMNRRNMNWLCGEEVRFWSTDARPCVPTTYDLRHKKKRLAPLFYVRFNLNDKIQGVRY